MFMTKHKLFLDNETVNLWSIKVILDCKWVINENVM